MVGFQAFQTTNSAVFTEFHKRSWSPDIKHTADFCRSVVHNKHVALAGHTAMQLPLSRICHTHYCAWLVFFCFASSITPVAERNEFLKSSVSVFLEVL